MKCRKIEKKILYLQKSKPHRAMKTINGKGPSILEKMLEDKKAIQKCIKEGGDLRKVAEERNVKFATPL